MGYFKKITDICAGAAAFLCAIFFLRKYMAFEPEIGEKLPSKLEQFLKPDESADYSMLIPLIVILILSIAVGIVFRRFPYLCFGFSLLPASHVALMLHKGVLYNEVALVIILVALHVLGNLVECLARDNEDGGHRLSIAAKISSAFGGALCFYAIWLSKGDVPKDPKEIEALTVLENEMLFVAKPLDIEILSDLFWMFAILLAVSLILYNVYFIDAVLALVPAIYAIHANASGNLGTATYLFVAAALICSATHLILAVFENNLSKKEQRALKKAQE